MLERTRRDYDRLDGMRTCIVGRGHVYGWVGWKVGRGIKNKLGMKNSSMTVGKISKYAIYGS